MKRSQITLFIIFALVILIIFIAVFSLFGWIKNPLVRKDINQISSFIEGSLEIATRQCVNKIGMQGGRYTPQTYLEKPFSNIEYAYFADDTFLSLSEIKSEMQNCISEIMTGYIDGFEDFKKRGYKIEFGNIASDVIPATEHVTVSIHFPVTVEIGDETYNLEDFNLNMVIRLRHLHNITDTATKRRAVQLKASDIDMTYLGTLDINSTVYHEEDGGDIYSLNDRKSKINNKNYIFLAGNRYSR